MRHQFAGITICLLWLCVGCLGKDKDRDWKVGRVQDSTSSKSTLTTGATSTTNTSGTGSATTSGTAVGGSLNATTNASSRSQQTTDTTIQHMTIRETELLVIGADYAYVIEDPFATHGPLITRAVMNHKHGCRFIIGEDIKYVQDKGKLIVLDPDGKECKLDIVKQERVH